LGFLADISRGATISRSFREAWQGDSLKSPGYRRQRDDDIFTASLSAGRVATASEPAVLAMTVISASQLLSTLFTFDLASADIAPPVLRDGSWPIAAMRASDERHVDID
jgi:hypothetical protein